MSRCILIRQADGSESRLADSDLPFSIGSGPGSHILLPGADPVTAYVGDARGHLFVQPVDGSTTPLLHNDRVLSESAWLKSNDQLRCQSLVVNFHRSGDRVTFSVTGETQQPRAPELAPPQHPPQQPLAGDNGAAIPVAVNRPRKMGRSRKIAVGLVALGAVLLGCALLFVLLARPLELQITPPPDRLSIAGFPAPVKIGSRYLVLPGTYTARISKQGYQPHTQELVITRGAENTLRVQLEKLPGILNLDITPADGVSVFSGDTLLAATPPARITIQPGKHRLILKKERYQPYEVEIFIDGAGVEQQLTAVLDPDWADITIISEPAGAQVQIDGTVVGSAPITRPLLSGNRLILLSKELFVSREQSIDVQAGVDADYRYSLEPLPARLALSSRPAGAVVSIANKYRGTTPVTLTLPSGVDQKIGLSLPAHKALEYSINLSPGEEKELQLLLEQETGVVYLTTTPADAEVSINGKKLANVQGELSLPAVPQKFEVSLPGYKSVSRTITPNSGFSQQLAIDLVPVSGVGAPAAVSALSDEPFVTAAGHKLVLIEPSPFTMGAPRREPGRRANEREREVSMSRPFLIGEKPVTNEEFRKFDSSHNSGAVGGYSLDGDRQPVVNLTWNQAVEYLNWLSQQDNLEPFYVRQGDGYVADSPVKSGYRLPTEAEWAYTTRQAAERRNQRYPWPGGFPPRTVVANLADESARTIIARVISGYDDGYPVTAPVGSFPADKAGLYDIAGNVSEWCHDFYSAYTAAALSTVTDPLGPPSGTHKVIRGSSWRDGSVTETRLSYRAYHKESRDNVGFRIARYP